MPTYRLDRVAAEDREALEGLLRLACLEVKIRSGMASDWRTRHCLRCKLSRSRLHCYRLRADLDCRLSFPRSTSQFPFLGRVQTQTMMLVRTLLAHRSPSSGRVRELEPLTTCLPRKASCLHPGDPYVTTTQGSSIRCFFLSTFWEWMTVHNDTHSLHACFICT